jgi:1-deoxy-D-xylulose-5-phosphate synthase
VIHDVATQKLPVIFCLDRGGLVGEDGPTHHGVFDLAYFRPIPNMIISAPMDEIELRNLMFTAQSEKHLPFVIRYPRGRGVLKDWKKPFEKIEIGSARTMKEGNDLAILTLGNVGNFANEAIQQLSDNHSIAHYDMRFLKPIDKNLLHTIFKKFDKIITVENGTVVGGLGSAVIDFMNEKNYQARVKMLGIPDRFIQHGTPEELYAECGFDVEGIKKSILNLL